MQMFECALNVDAVLRDGMGRNDDAAAMTAVDASVHVIWVCIQMWRCESQGTCRYQNHIWNGCCNEWWKEV